MCVQLASYRLSWLAGWWGGCLPACMRRLCIVWHRTDSCALLSIVLLRALPSNVLFDGFSKKKFVDRSVDSFAVFKDGIRPEWEDPANKTGSEWSIRKGTLRRQQ